MRFSRCGIAVPFAGACPGALRLRVATAIFAASDRPAGGCGAHLPRSIVAPDMASRNNHSVTTACPAAGERGSGPWRGLGRLDCSAEYTSSAATTTERLGRAARGYPDAALTR